MPKNIEPKLMKIGEYLKLEKGKVFVIPEYQRAYSWLKDHCDKLWQDILDFEPNDNEDKYFFGTIIINCQKDDKEFALVDGQQRTTTFLLLLKALLLRINVAIGRTEGDDDSKSLCRGLRERRRKIMSILYKAEAEEINDEPSDTYDADICRNVYILKNESINESHAEDLIKILQSLDFNEAEAKVHKIPRKQGDNRYTNFFRNFKYFYNEIGDLSDSQLNSITKTITDNCEVIEIKSWQLEQAIAMFNSLNSDGLPLYDADIISAQLYAKAKKIGESEEFAKYWRELLELADELKKAGITNIDSLLNQRMYYERAIRKEIINDNGGINVTTPGLKRYFTSLNTELLNQPVELCKGLINLAKIWIKISGLPIVQVLFKFNENTKLFLASYFYRLKEEEISEDKIRAILECMLRLFAVLEIVDIGYSSKQFKTFLFGEEIKLVDPDIGTADIKTDFDKHINKEWKRENIKAAILDYDKNALVYLNEFLFAREKGMCFAFGNKCDIEHIMPSSGHNLSEIRRDANLVSEEEFKEIVNKLGNKILLEEKINRAIGNEWFRTKVTTDIGVKTGYKKSAYPIAKTLVADFSNVDKPYWKKGDINKATEKIANRIVTFIFDGFPLSNDESNESPSVLIAENRIENSDLNSINLIEECSLENNVENNSQLDENTTSKSCKNSNTTETQRNRLQFWTKLNDVIKQKNIPLSTRTPSTDHWCHFAIGSSKCAISIELVNRDKRIRVALSITNCKDLYNYLYEKKNEIENAFDEELMWESKPKNNVSRAFLYIPNFDFNNKNNHLELINSIIVKILKFKEVFKPYIMKYKELLALQ